MKRYITIALLLFAYTTSVQAQKGQTLKNNLDSLSYSFGVLIGNNIQIQGIKEIDKDLFMKGFKDGMEGEPSLMDLEAANIFIQD